MARVSGGLSQREAGRAVGMSHSEWGRIERGELETVTVEQLALACAAVGLVLSIRTYPLGDPVRDAGQLRYAALVGELLPPHAVWRTEVPFPRSGDPRAWDGVASLDGRRAAFEIEVRVLDVQALDRRMALKLRDGGLDVLILVVPGTRANRRALATHREALRSRFPLDSPAIHAAFAAGSLPDRCGILVL